MSHFAGDPGRDVLPFPVLVDPAGAVARAYGAYAGLSLRSLRTAKPATFVIGPDRTVRYAHVGKHPQDRPPLETVLEQVPSP